MFRQFAIFGWFLASCLAAPAVVLGQAEAPQGYNSIQAGQDAYAAGEAQRQAAINGQVAAQAYAMPGAWPYAPLAITGRPVVMGTAAGVYTYRVGPGRVTRAYRPPVAVWFAPMPGMAPPYAVGAWPMPFYAPPPAGSVMPSAQPPMVVPGEPVPNGVETVPAPPAENVPAPAGPREF